MSKIKSKNSAPEIAVRKLLHSLGFRYKLYDSTLPGKPDLVFPKYKMALFVHGCFWHCHSGCKRSNMPSSNRGYWVEKLDNNVKRDMANQKEIKKLGWNTAVVWECETKDDKQLQKIIDKIFMGIKIGI